MHWKTKLLLDLMNNPPGYYEGSGGPTIDYTFKLDKTGKETITIPYEAQEFLDMAQKLIYKADVLIEKASKTK